VACRSAGAVVQVAGQVVRADVRADDVEVPVAVHVDRHDAVRLVAGPDRLLRRKPPSPAPRRIQTSSLVLRTRRGRGSVVVEVRRAVRAGLDADRLARQHRLEEPAAVATVQKHAHVRADLVDGGQIEEAVAVEVARRRAVDARLSRSCGSRTRDLREAAGARRRRRHELEGISRRAERRRVGGLEIVRQVHEHELARRERMVGRERDGLVAFENAYVPRTAPLHCPNTRNVATPTVAVSTARSNVTATADDGRHHRVQRRRRGDDLKLRRSDRGQSENDPKIQRSAMPRNRTDRQRTSRHFDVTIRLFRASRGASSTSRSRPLRRHPTVASHVRARATGDLPRASTASSIPKTKRPTISHPIHALRAVFAPVVEHVDERIPHLARRS
jgi:hypothetical protein